MSNVGWWLAIAAICFGIVNSVLVQNQNCRTSKNETAGANDKLCLFPFIYNNRTYHSCTYDDSYADGFKPWCSVETDEEGVHVYSEDGSTYGICDDFENCPIPPQYCGIPDVVHKNVTDTDFDVTIEQQPWMVSLGRFVGQTSWEPACGGSLITNRHILTAAHCIYHLQDEELRKRYIMRLGITDFKLATKFDGIERKIIYVMVHPKYQRPAIHFDVGIAVADQIIEFGKTIRPICLPFRPIDDPDHLKEKFVNLAGWGIKDLSNEWVSTNLHIYNLKVLSKDACSTIISNNDGKSSIPKRILSEKFPKNLTKELACIEDTLLVEKACQDDSGSPVVVGVNGTTQGIYFEQHFVLAWRHDCNQPTMIFIRISSRPVLSWIQKMTGTSPSLMVVAGDTEPDYLNPGHTALSNVEVLSSSADYCQIPVSGLPEDIKERLDSFGQLRNASESDLAGLTGYFANNVAIVCGGNNVFSSSEVCYELNAKNNSWIKTNNMKYRRNQAAATTDNAGNLWVIGGYDNCKKSNTSEVYNYKPNGNGTWNSGVALPSVLDESSIKDHCVVRINSTHTFMVGGTAQIFVLSDGFAEETDTSYTDCAADNAAITNFNVTNVGGGAFLKKAWIYDGKQWTNVPDMSVARANPACSLVEMDDGEIGILVTSGCDGFCLAANAPKVYRSTEVYNLQTGEWILRKAELPNQLNLGKMEILDGLPTFVGGYNEDIKNTSHNIYQYHWDRDEWILHPSLRLTYPRHNFALFQVPKNLFGIC